MVEKIITACDDVLFTLFRSAYFLTKEIVPLTKFLSFYKLFLKIKSNYIKKITIMKSQVLK